MNIEHLPSKFVIQNDTGNSWTDYITNVSLEVDEFV